jgi:pimeloyl-ACP methyl ester carboxylesterase
VSTTIARPRWRELVAIVLLRDVPFWRGSLRRRIARLLAAGAYTYVGVLIVLLALENRLLFPGATFSGEWFEPPAGLAVEDVELGSTDGNVIHAWWAAPPGWRPRHGAVLYSHGNAGNLSARGHSVLRWRREANRAVLIYDYPGYGRSTGKPTEAGCYAAAEAAYDFLVGRRQVPPEEVILLGSSLGAAMATDLAVRRPHRLLVLINPFTSFPDMAQKVVPWLPARWLVRNRLDNLGKIGKCPSPVFITHGTADQVIPFGQGKRLFAAAPEPKRFYPREGDPHRHPEDPGFFGAVLAFLDQTRAK